MRRFRGIEKKVGWRLGKSRESAPPHYAGLETSSSTHADSALTEFEAQLIVKTRRNETCAVERRQGDDHHSQREGRSTWEQMPLPNNHAQPNTRVENSQS